MMRIALALLAVVGALSGSGFPDTMPPELAAPPGWLLRAPGLRELAPADLAGRPARFAAPLGEKLTYQVRYFGVDVGPAMLEVARYVEVGGRRYAHLVATARTNEFWTKLYRVDDRSEAWVDLDTGRVERTRTRTLHGGREAREEIRYDWASHFVTVRKAKVHRASVREDAFDFGPFVHDVFDAFYALRRVPYRDGLEVELPVCASRKIHGFRVRYAGKRDVLAAALGPAPVAALELRPYDTIDGKAHAVGDGQGLRARRAEPRADPPRRLVPLHRLHPHRRRLGRARRLGARRAGLAGAGAARLGSPADRTREHGGAAELGRAGGGRRRAGAGGDRRVREEGAPRAERRRSGSALATGAQERPRSLPRR